MKSYLAHLDRFGQGNFFVKVDHSDSSVKSLEVRDKGSLGLACPYFVKVVQKKISRWRNVSRL